jgi:uncharacterized protein with FMN-binding domain
MRRVILAIVSTVAALVMILSFKTHGTSSIATPPAVVSSLGTTSGTDTTTGSASAGATGSPSPGGTPASGGTSTGTRTVTGGAADTPFGPVQVKVTVTDGKLTSVSAVDYPVESRRDEQINAYAIPVLNQEALAASSANIDMVSGATYTSTGYIQSLQSALDLATK